MKLQKFQFKAKKASSFTKSNDTPEDIKKRVLQIHEALHEKTYTTKIITGSKGDKYTLFKVYSSDNQCIDKICSCKGYYYRFKCRHLSM